LYIILLTIAFAEKKLHAHTQSSVKRREPGILKLATTYNDLCRQLSKLIATNKAPEGAIQPDLIQRDGLFKLDVDDDIWQDIGLDDDQDSPLPLWLCNEKVRDGIKALLEHDRCCEEESRLQRERCAMQEWMMEEWTCNQTAQDTTRGGHIVTSLLKNADPNDRHKCCIIVSATTSS
jgi:hypothetical protein